MRTGMMVAALMALLLGTQAADAAFELMADNNIGKFRAFYVLGMRIALADPDGLTLYTYEKDGFEKSNCAGECLRSWPPMLAVAGDKGGFESLSVFTREDGQQQWAHTGRPLYRSVKDTAPGTANGNGVDDAWYIVEVGAHEM